MSLEEYISKLEELTKQAVDMLPEMEKGKLMFARHHNTFVDWLSNAVLVAKELYERFKAKTGKTLPDVEHWLGMVESRYELNRKVKFGGYVYPRDHNLTIDAMKPLEVLLRRMEEEL